MDKMIKAFVSAFVSSLLCITVSSLAYAEKGDIGLTFKGQRVSAKFTEVPLRIILEKLEREKAIWFKGSKSLFEEKVTVQFTHLSLEKALKRILGTRDYSLVFDNNKSLRGVILIGKGDASQTPPKAGTHVSSTRAISTPMGGKEVSPRSGGNVTEGTSESRKETRKSKGNTSPVGSAKGKAQGPLTFKRVKNSPPPGNPNTKPIDTTIVKNCPPPGNPNAKPIDTTIVKNCPPE